MLFLRPLLLFFVREKKMLCSKDKQNQSSVSRLCSFLVSPLVHVWWFSIFLRSFYTRFSWRHRVNMPEHELNTEMVSIAYFTCIYHVTFSLFPPPHDHVLCMQKKKKNSRKPCACRCVLWLLCFKIENAKSFFSSLGLCMFDCGKCLLFVCTFISSRTFSVAYLQQLFFARCTRSQMIE